MGKEQSLRRTASVRSVCCIWYKSSTAVDTLSRQDTSGYRPIRIRWLSQYSIFSFSWDRSGTREVGGRLTDAEDDIPEH